MMALEAIREIVEFGEGLVGRLLLFDARAMRFETLAYSWDEDNPLNGADHRRPGDIARYLAAMTAISTL